MLWTAVCSGALSVFLSHSLVGQLALLWLADALWSSLCMTWSSHHQACCHAHPSITRRSTSKYVAYPTKLTTQYNTIPLKLHHSDRVLLQSLCLLHAERLPFPVELKRHPPPPSKLRQEVFQANCSFILSNSDAVTPYKIIIFQGWPDAFANDTPWLYIDDVFMWLPQLDLTIFTVRLHLINVLYLLKEFFTILWFL